MEANKSANQPNWKLRRIAIFGLLFLCTVVICYVVGWGQDTELHRAALAWAFGSAVATVFAYAGFATFEDIKLFSPVGNK